MIDISRMPESAICRVRGIGVAVRVSTCTSARRALSASLCLTPKCCSSSTITRPRSLNWTCLDSTAWVPMTISISPDARPARVSAASAAGTRRESRRTLTGQPWNAGLEGREVLARQQGGGADQRHLPPAHGHDEGRAQRHLGLAEADVAADQPVHGLAGRQIGEHVADGVELILGFLIGEPGAELVEQAVRGPRSPRS